MGGLIDGLWGRHGGRWMETCEFYDERLGADVHVTVRDNATRVSCRWRGGKLYATIPPGVEAGYFMRVMEELLPAIKDSTPRLSYHIGQVVALDGYSILIAAARRGKVRLSATVGRHEAKVLVGEGVDLASMEGTVGVSRLMCRIAHRVAADIVLPHAREVSARVGVRPGAWTVSTGRRTLGHCSARGVIALSSVLLFLPRHLREYVVCHELAHLSEMNHSAAFHRVCDGYCGGREAQWRRELRGYKWPIVK